MVSKSHLTNINPGKVEGLLCVTRPNIRTKDAPRSHGTVDEDQTYVWSILWSSEWLHVHFLQITASPMLMEKDGDNLPEEVVEKRAVVSKDYRRDIKGKNSSITHQNYFRRPWISVLTTVNTKRILSWDMLYIMRWETRKNRITFWHQISLFSRKKKKKDYPVIFNHPNIYYLLITNHMPRTSVSP